MIQAELIKQDEMKKFKCQFCELKLENYHKWSKHYQLYHNVSFLPCEFCSAEYPSKKDLEQHIKDKHTDGQNARYECSSCISTFKSFQSLQKHIYYKHKSKNKIFTCQKCNKTYKTKQTYNRHLRISHVPLTYVKCQKCPKIFLQKQTLKRHMEVQHSINYVRAKCPYCANSYKFREHLFMHIQTKHFAKEKTEICDSSKVAVSSENKCNLCSISFLEKSALLEHRKNVHDRNIKIYNCDHCTAVFKIKEAYKDHLQKEHNISVQNQSGSDDKEYVFKNIVDFESIIMNDFELKQFIDMKKRFKSHQRLAIVSNSNYTESFSTDELDESEANVVKRNISSFFNSLLSPYTPIENGTKNDTKEYSDTEQTKDSQESNVIDTQANYFEVPCLQETLSTNNNVLGPLKLDSLPEISKEVRQISEKYGLTVESNIANVIIPKETVTFPEVIINPKIAFNCLECNKLFDNEDLLKYHLIIAHKKCIKHSNVKLMQKRNNRKNLKAILRRRKAVVQHGILDPSLKEANSSTQSDVEVDQNFQNKILNENKVTKIIEKVQNNICVTDSPISRSKRRQTEKSDCVQNFKQKRMDRQFSQSPQESLPSSFQTSETRMDNICENNDVSSLCKGKDKSKNQGLPYICIQCNTGFNNKLFLLEHYKQKHGIQRVCKYCDKTFKLAAHLATHIKYHHSRFPKKDKQKNLQVLDASNDNTVTKENTLIPTQLTQNKLNKSSMFHCLQCSALFPDKKLLQRHYLWEHESNVTLHKCCQCGSIFYQLGDLEDHMEVVHKTLF